jgi:DNA-binding MarR family transcriptional regulator
MDIIRRMIEAGFMAQSDNPEDGRSKLLHITPEGRDLIDKLSTRMDFVAELVTGNLSSEELHTLVFLLEKLENYHQLIQAKTKGGDFADLIRAVKTG